MNIIDEIRASDAQTISPELAGKALGIHPQSIRVAAEKQPDLLGFPVIRTGRTTRIPRLPFLKHLGYE